MEKQGTEAEWMTPREAARAAGVDVQTLRNWERAGTLPRRAVRRLPSGHRRYRKSAIDRVLSSRAS